MQVAFKGKLNVVGDSNIPSRDYMYDTNDVIGYHRQLGEIDDSIRDLASIFDPEDTIEINHKEDVTKYIPGETSKKIGLTEKSLKFPSLKFYDQTFPDFVKRAEVIKENVKLLIKQNMEQMTKMILK